MKILITGGAGFIGSHLQDKLIALGHEVTVVDILRSGKKHNIHPRTTFYEVDICDAVGLENAVLKCKPQAIFHFAAQIDVGYSIKHPFEDHRINLIGTLNVLEAARKNAVKKIVYANTGGAFYGEVPLEDLPISEDHVVIKPTSFYGVSKLCAEYYIRLYGNIYKIPWVSLRYANVYGPRQDGNSETGVIAIFINTLLHNQQPIINGDGKHTRDFVYVDDVVEANIQALQFPASDYFNIATGIETSNSELFHLINYACKTSYKPSFGPERKGDVRRSSLNIQKAEKLLGWKPRVSLKEGLDKTIHFYRTKPKPLYTAVR